MSDSAHNPLPRTPGSGRPERGLRPVQFRLVNLLAFVALAAALFSLARSIGVDPRVAAVSVFFLAVVALALELMRLSGGDQVVVRETGSQTAAETIANFLRHQDIPAEVVTADLGLAARVIVPAEHEQEARRLLAEFESGQPSDDRDEPPPAE
jgi:hypothetical protein